MKSSRAFTLVEMVTSLSIGSVLIVLAIGTIHRTMRIESSLRNYDRAERTAAQLSRQFRTDIHQAERIELDHSQGNQLKLLLTLPGQSSVVYRLESNHVRREQRLNEQQVHRENFSFPKQYSIDFQERSSPSRAILTVHQNSNPEGVPPRLQLHVEAVIGKFLQSTQLEEVSP